MANKKLPRPSRTKPLVLLHISPRKNRKSILSNGLTVDMTNSGYGEKPVHNAVYLYHDDNINIIYDMINTFDDFDVYEVYIKDDTYLIPDEDSKADTWQRSLQTFGTCAYASNIDRRDIKFMINVNRK